MALPSPDSDEFLEKYGFGKIPAVPNKNGVRVTKSIVYFSILFIVLFMLESRGVYLKVAEACVVIIIRTVIDRICFFLNEMFSLIPWKCCGGKERENKNGRYQGPWEVLSACFNDIAGLRIVAVFTVCLPVLYNDPEKIKRQLLQDFFAIGVAVFIVFLLQLDSQPKVQKSENDELEEKFSANSLAWHYFSELKYILENLDDKLSERPSNDIVELRTLFILLPLNCDVKKDPADIDRNIKRCSFIQIRPRVKTRPRKIGVYEIGSHKVLLDFPLELNTLFEMSDHALAKGIQPADRSHQVRLFYRTLEHILKQCYLSPSCERQWELIPFDLLSLKSNIGSFMKEAVLPLFCNCPSCGNASSHGGGEGNGGGGYVSVNITNDGENLESAESVSSSL